MTEHSSYPVPGSVHRDWLDKGGLSPRIMRYIEHVEGEAAALRADLEQTTDERNALLHARTALRAELAEANRIRVADVQAAQDRAEAFIEEHQHKIRDELERVTTERDHLDNVQAAYQTAIGLARLELSGVNPDPALAMQRLNRGVEESDALNRAYRVATSEQETSDCTTCGGTGEEEFAIPGTDHDTAMGPCSACKASEQEARGTTTFHCYVCDAPDGECDREKHRARDEQEVDDA